MSRRRHRGKEEGRKGEGHLDIITRTDHTLQNRPFAGGGGQTLDWKEEEEEFEPEGSTRPTRPELLGTPCNLHRWLPFSSSGEKRWFHPSEEEGTKEDLF